MGGKGEGSCAVDKMWSVPCFLDPGTRRPARDRNKELIGGGVKTLGFGVGRWRCQDSGRFPHRGRGFSGTFHLRGGRAAGSPGWEFTSTAQTMPVRR